MRFGERLNGGLNVSEWLNVNPKGIKAIGATSDTISGGFRIIRFESSGKLIVNNPSANLEYLLVGGGGGGGSINYTAISTAYDAGGGGGGSVVTNIGSPTNFLKGEYRIVVGTGGSPFNNGLPSIFGDIVAYGGGAGAGVNNLSFIGAKSGGNGGGASGNSAQIETGGQPLFSGFAGGDSDAGSGFEGAGGGGAGAVGANASGASGGAGGAGVANSITGTSVTYGGGGGGGCSDSGTAGAGGSGGGGAGSKNANATNGTNFLGGGGGGAGRTTGVIVYTGGTGGTGLVVVRYAV